jgi:hypothetical protein
MNHLLEAVVCPVVPMKRQNSLPSQKKGRAFNGKPGLTRRLASGSFLLRHYSLFRGMRSRPPRWKRMLFR